MQSQFEALRDRLLQGGVAPRYVRRYIAELSDHAADIAAEAERAGHLQSTEATVARLGKIDDLANAMIDRRELGAWTTRAPWAVFLLAPSAVLVAINVLSVVAMVLLVKALLPPAGMKPTFAPSGWLADLAVTANAFYAYALPLLLGWCVALLAVRRRMRPLWPLTGLVVVACLAAAIQIRIDLPTPHRLGEISLGVEQQGNTFVFSAIRNLLLTVAFYFGLKSLQLKYFREHRHDLI